MHVWFTILLRCCPAAGRYAPGVIEVQLAVQRLIKRSGAQVYFAGESSALSLEP